MAAADAERRRIERDLHDGAQQHLVALAINLGAARDAVDTDPAAAATLLDQLAADVREAVEEVRDLARGIYPPLLSDAGLGEALRAAARRSPAPVTVHVDAEVDRDRAPAAVEAAIYFCCLEALQNVAKHAADAASVERDGHPRRRRDPLRGPRRRARLRPGGADRGLRARRDGRPPGRRGRPADGGQRARAGDDGLRRGPHRPGGRLVSGREPRALGAVRAIAVVEVRRRWRSLLLLGLAIGVLGGAVAGSLVVARRTATAFDRLVAASALGDARALVFDVELAEQIVALPEVEESWTAHLAVARLEGGDGVIYSGWTFGPTPPPGLQDPVVVEGRGPDPSALDEVLVTEGYADQLGVALGDQLRFRFLAPEEVARFDSGFGEPDGPEVTARIVGTVRLPSGVDQSPVLATPAFAARYGDEVGAGVVLAVRLREGVSMADFRASVDRLAETSTPVPGAEEFAPVEVTAAAGDPTSVAASARVLVVGLVLFAAVATVTGLVAASQALVRHHLAGAGAQRVESALGPHRR